MAVLQKMREKFGVAISIIIALSLLYFIAPMDDIINLFSKPQDVGEIAGTGISYEDFQAEVNTFTTVNEIMTGSTVQNDQTQQQIRNAAWQSMLDRYMFFKNCDAAGIKVSDAEVADLIVGDHISPVILQNPFFLDENGEFSIERIREFNSEAQDNERAKAYWEYLKNSIRTQQFYTKYASLFTASSMVSPATLEEEIAMGNTTADIELVAVPYGYRRDTTVNVSGAEIKSYYKAHKKDYKQQASRDIRYVVYEVVPSTADIKDAELKVASSLGEFATTTNMKNFLLKNSDRNYSEYWYKAGELKTISEDVDNFAFSGKAGVSPVYQSGNTFYAARVMNSANVPDSISVKHILLQGANAKTLADSIATALKGKASFETLAVKYSADKNSNVDGVYGNLGWMTQSYILPGFESLMTAELNKPYVVKTQWGTHVAVVTKRSKPIAKKQVAVIEKTALASKETFNSYYSQANTFATLANGKAAGFHKAVDSLGVYAHVQNNVLESTSTYGSIDQAKELTRWIFDAKKGAASGIITVNNNYFFVAAVENVHKEGVATLDEVKASIQNKLYTEKRNANKTASVAATIEGLPSIEAAAEALGSTVTSRADVSLSPMSNSGLEPAVLGAIYKAPLGQVYGPIQGKTSVYVLKVTGRQTGSFYTENDAKMTAAQKANYSTNMLMPVMQEAAGVVDNRARYF